MYATQSRQLKKQDMKELWTQRIVAGAEQHMTNPINTFYAVQDGLMKNNIQLNRMSLANLAVYEPATFEALTKIALHFKEDDEGSGSNN